MKSVQWVVQRLDGVHYVYPSRDGWHPGLLGAERFRSRARARKVATGIGESARAVPLRAVAGPVSALEVREFRALLERLAAQSEGSADACAVDSLGRAVQTGQASGLRVASDLARRLLETT